MYYSVGDDDQDFTHNYNPLSYRSMAAFDRNDGSPGKGFAYAYGRNGEFVPDPSEHVRKGHAYGRDKVLEGRAFGQARAKDAREEIRDKLKNGHAFGKDPLFTNWRSNHAHENYTGYYNSYFGHSGVEDMLAQHWKLLSLAGAVSVWYTSKEKKNKPLIAGSILLLVGAVYGAYKAGVFSGAGI